MKRLNSLFVLSFFLIATPLFAGATSRRAPRNVLTQTQTAAVFSIDISSNGTKTTYNEWTIITCTGSTSISVTGTKDSYWQGVGSGGGGGAGRGGGGAGGEVIKGTTTLTPGTYHILIGASAPGGAITTGNKGTTGNPTIAFFGTAFSTTAIGGGFGGAAADGQPGIQAGRGQCSVPNAGGSDYNALAGTGTKNNGGAGSLAAQYPDGGGAGDGGNGTAGLGTTAGSGGPGTAKAWPGASGNIGGGAGGGCYTNAAAGTAGIGYDGGGNGGGPANKNSYVKGADGTPNTGGGAGGATMDATVGASSKAGGDSGSGIFVIWYLTPA